MADIDLKSLIGRLNRFCTKALESAAGLCVSRTHYEVTIEHCLHVMIEDPGADLQLICRHFGVDHGRVLKAISRSIEVLKSGNAGRPVFSPLLVEWFRQGWLIGTLNHGLTEIRSGILLLVILENPVRFISGDYEDTFAEIKKSELAEKFHEIVEGSSETAVAPQVGAAPGGEEPYHPAEDSALGRFCQNFTERARGGEIDPVFGRDREIRQMVDILARRRKNNPICVGEAGVGKSAVVEGLALRIAEGDVPDILKNVDLIGLDMGLLQAGASMKGEFEKRLKGVIDEVKASPKPLILFIDEAHTLIGAGAGAGGGDAANLLKPALARGALKTVAATTWSEYKKYFEKDAALARRFQLVKLDEPDAAGAATMLRGLRSRYEQAHGVIIRDDAVVAAAEMGSRYISGRQHPDKGVDLMDTASARVKIALTTKPGQIEDLERHIQDLERELAAHVRDRETGVEGLDECIEELEGEIKSVNDEVTTLTEKWQAEKSAAERVIEARKNLTDAQGLSETGESTEEREEEKEGEAEEGPPADVEVLRKELWEAMAALKELQGKDPLVPTEVTAEVVSQVIADWTGIPLGKMVSDEASTLLKFEEELGERIKGQDHVLDIVGEAIRAAKAGINPPEQPIGVFLFVGPSGVGKTETALGVADMLFGGEHFMTTINMSEFQEKHTVSRLIGSPPGYVGYGEGGVLTEGVRQRPYSVVLLDEVEKADAEVMNLFYQVFDKGMLSDGEGREVDFKNTVIFMTSNLATDIITQAALSDTPPSVSDLIQMIRPTLNQYFKPALVGRMTLVPFYPISADAMKMISRLKLGKLQKRLMETHKIKCEIDDEVVDAIADRCTEVETGARNVDHILRGTLLPRISSELLHKMSEGGMPETLNIGLAEDGDFQFTFG
ncbi:MAG: type VI secretion system ATPase TssH [Planctomycetota bacterium]|jgi:type VI secretion system protein VasG